MGDATEVAGAVADRARREADEYRGDNPRPLEGYTVIDEPGCTRIPRRRSTSRLLCITWYAALLTRMSMPLSRPVMIAFLPVSFPETR